MPLWSSFWRDPSVVYGFGNFRAGAFDRNDLGVFLEILGFLRFSGV